MHLQCWPFHTSLISSPWFPGHLTGSFVLMQTTQLAITQVVSLPCSSLCVEDNCEGFIKESNLLQSVCRSYNIMNNLIRSKLGTSGLHVHVQ